MKAARAQGQVVQGRVSRGENVRVYPEGGRGPRGLGAKEGLAVSNVVTAVSCFPILVLTWNPPD